MRTANPLHALDWIDSFGCRLRLISSGELRRRLGRSKGRCTWCGKQVPAGRRMWCSQSCVSDFNMRCNPSSARWAVEKRDQGVCCQCGFDAQKFQRIRRDVQQEDWWYGSKLPALLGFGNRSHFWEMDHILPVAEGGGLCGLENLRTLCIPCHMQHSADLAARLAIERRADLVDSKSDLE